MESVHDADVNQGWNSLVGPKNVLMAFSSLRSSDARIRLDAVVGLNLIISQQEKSRFWLTLALKVFQNVESGRNAL